jgi:hypothetical protein
MKTRRRRIKKNKSIKRGGEYTPFIDPNTGKYDYGVTKPDDTSSSNPYIIGSAAAVAVAAGVGLIIYFL